MLVAIKFGSAKSRFKIVRKYVHQTENRFVVNSGNL